MKCSKCNVEMQKGQLGGSGNLWLEKIVSTKAAKLFSMSNNPFVYAFKCPNCGKVELLAEVTK